MRIELFMSFSNLFSSYGHLAFLGIALLLIFTVEMIIIFRALSNDFKRFAQKGTLLLRKSEPTLLEYKKINNVKLDDALSKNFQFKNIHNLEMIFDLPEGHIKDIEFTENEELETSAAKNNRALFADFLTETQRKKIYSFSVSYSGYADFLGQVERKLNWKSGINKKVLVLTDIKREKKITFLHYLSFEKSTLFDVVDPEIFWGVDICVAVTTEEALPTIKKNKVDVLLEKYDEIWLFEPQQHNGLMLKMLGLQEDDKDNKVVNEAYDH